MGRLSAAAANANANVNVNAEKVFQPSEAQIVSRHVIALSAAVDKATAFGIDESNVFGFWDWVGGRYSVCSAVGAMPLALQYGFPVVQKFLQGAHSVDKVSQSVSQLFHFFFSSHFCIAVVLISVLEKTLTHP